jgi:hypothetical protein
MLAPKAGEVFQTAAGSMSMDCSSIPVAELDVATKYNCCAVGTIHVSNLNSLDSNKSEKFLGASSLSCKQERSLSESFPISGR